MSEPKDNTPKGRAMPDFESFADQAGLDLDAFYRPAFVAKYLWKSGLLAQDWAEQLQIANEKNECLRSQLAEMLPVVNEAIHWMQFHPAYGECEFMDKQEQAEREAIVSKLAALADKLSKK